MRYAISIEGTGGDLVKGVLQVEVEGAKRARIKLLLDQLKAELRSELGEDPKLRDLRRKP